MRDILPCNLSYDSYRDPSFSSSASLAMDATGAQRRRLDVLQGHLPLSARVDTSGEPAWALCRGYAVALPERLGRVSSEADFNVYRCRSFWLSLLPRVLTGPPETPTTPPSWPRALRRRTMWSRRCTARRSGGLRRLLWRRQRRVSRANTLRQTCGRLLAQNTPRRRA